MKRTLSIQVTRDSGLVIAGTCLIAGTYGLVRLAYGLFLPDIRESLSMSAGVAGYVSSGASLAYCVGALCGFAAADHARRLVVAAMLTAGVGATGMALAPGLGTFVPFAVLSSAGAGLASPALVAIIGRRLSGARSPRAQATVNAGTGPGLVAVGLLALALLPDWRLGLALGAVLTVVAGVGVLALDRPRTAETDLDGAARRGPSDPARPPWSRGVVDALVGPACGALLLGAASAVVWTYGRTHLIDEGASSSTSTLAWVALGVGGTLTILTTPVLTALHPARAWLLSMTTVAVSIAALGLNAASLSLALVSCLVFGWGFVAATSALVAWAALLAPAEAAAATSVLFVTIVAGQAAGSAGAGAIADHHGMAAAFITSAAVACVGAACGQRRRAQDRRARPGFAA